MTTNQKPLPFIKSGEEPEGKGVSSVKVTYSDNDAYNPVFQYNSEDKNYTRSAGGEQTTDKDTGNPVSVANLLVIEAPHEVFDNEGRRKIDLESGGVGYLFQKGKEQRIHWENENGRIIALKNGKEVGFVPGKAWISVVPDNPGAESAIQTANE
ncbi:DUF3048 C-terminal domain-containing protein [Aciduricibacillus chroicocephali]|uniref:DUF3048 C-terminal domain-containing protein n=1 Tax=Aciduricibacillus chroicocephali TaxID=3054939 RepID=A0ABY9KXB4_9BACI|nr:DUF3048 C-terminal domain-containing protein [Bacillaceae bacterium 44XB]